MALKQVIIRKGEISVTNTPAPMIEPGTILVKTQISCISAGTEVAGLKTSAEPLWRRALKQPENVKKILAMAAQSGIKRTHAFVKGHLNAGNPTGYSAVGTVIAVADDITDFQIGDRVACAGAQCANHAEIIRIPKNLAVKIPQGLCFEHAATVTLGAIALQGVRRANPTIGETFVVIGLGILGQLTTQILLANGCQVVGIDLNADKIQLAIENGLQSGIVPEPGYDTDAVKRMTNGMGADGVIITAASSSHQIVADAFAMCRKKGRVVLVGDVGLDLQRHDIYAKELDFFVSCSYGPGRYDKSYEQDGNDYPIGYVRWTENRNMSAYLAMLEDKKINLDNLISKIFDLEAADQAYAALQDPTQPQLITLLKYNVEQTNIEHTVYNPTFKTVGANRIKVAVVGAGGFARGMHLPNLAKLDKYYEIYAIMSRTGHSANACATQYNAKYATTDYQTVLQDPNVDLIILCTPHDQHALQAEQAILAEKHVLVEKPLALNIDELEKIAHLVNQGPPLNTLLMTGFNRRFSPHIVRLKQVLMTRTNPIMINYRMNAGYIPLDHWVHASQGGGRNIGEACHIYDLFTFLTEAKVTDVTTSAINPQTAYYQANDNFTVTCQFADGSVANLMYTALGHSKFPKETMDVFFDGCVAHLNDYKSLNFYGRKLAGSHSKKPEKGQLQELMKLAEALQKQAAWPIPWWQQQQAMEIAYAVETALKTQGTDSCVA